MDKAGVYNTFFASVFNRDDEPRRCQYPELEDCGCKNDRLPADTDIMWDLLLHLYAYQSMGSHGTHPKVLQEFTDVIKKSFPVILEQSWEPRKVPADGSW